MVKFFKLVKNEYIKNLKKISTIIMLIVIVLSAIGLSAVSAIAKHEMQSDKNIIENADEVSLYQEENQWLEDTKPDGYKKDIAVNKYLEQKGFKPDSWQAAFAFNVKQNFDESILFAVLDDVIGGGDWKAACRALSDNAVNTAQKWEYEYRLENNIPFGDSWKDEVIESVAAAKSTIESVGDATDEESANNRATAEDIEKVGLYRLENNISENTADAMSLFDTYEADQVTFWTVFFQSTSLVSLIGLLIIVIAGSSVASEFSQGTIKFLLINPVKRWKILMAKYFTVISLGYVMLALLFLIMIPAAGLIVGFDGVSAPYVYVSGGEVHEISSFLQAIKLYLLNSVEVIVMATFAFSLSSLFKSAALAIGSGVFLMLSGSMIVQILALFKQDWARYLIFANTDLSVIYNGNSLFPQHSLTFALIVIALHMVVFLITAWDGFVKREC
ncbi:MAG: ABC transporter permease [Ruminococcus sp.]|nr:ABC transporter permease [Ruminococcus sp.]